MAGIADKLIRGSFFRILTPVANILVTFFMMPFVIRAIGDRWYGLWVLAAAFVGYYGFLDLGLSSANERFIAQALGRDDNEEVNNVFNTCLFLFFGVGILTLLTSIIIVIVTPHFVDDPTDIRIFRILILMIGFTMALSFPVRAFLGLLRAHIRFDIINIFEIIKLIIRTGLIVYFLGRGYGIITLAIISLGIEIVQLIVIVMFARLRYREVVVSISNFARNRIRTLFGYSVYSFIANIADKLQFHFGAFVITAFLGLALVTHFNVGARVTRYYWTLISNAIFLVMPVFSRLEGQKSYDQIREKFMLVVKLNTILSVFLGGSFIIYGKAFITRWMGNDYLDSYRVLVVLTIGLVFNTIQISSKALLFSLAKHKMYAIALTLEGLANLIVSLILVRKYGIVGVALGTTIPTMINNIFIIPVYTSRAINLKLTQYTKTVLSGILLGAAVHAASWLVIRNYIEVSYSRILILGLLTSFVYILSNVFVLLKKNERRYFKIPV